MPRHYFFSNAEEAEFQWFCEDPQDLLELTPKKRCPFLYMGLECKFKSQEIPGVTGKFGLGVQSETGQRLRVLSRESPGHSKHTLSTKRCPFHHREVECKSRKSRDTWSNRQI